MTGEADSVGCAMIEVGIDVVGTDVSVATGMELAEGLTGTVRLETKLAVGLFVAVGCVEEVVNAAVFVDRATVDVVVAEEVVVVLSASVTVEVVVAALLEDVDEAFC